MSQQEQQNKKKQKYWASFITGGIAGICAKTLVSPFERVKLIYVTRHTKFTYKSAIEDAIYIYQKHGIWDFFRGNGASVIRIFPFASINFATFDFFRNQFYKPIPDQQWIKKNIVLFLCGAASGMTATTFTYPLEFVRTRLAMEKNNFQYKNVFDGLSKIAKKEGVGELYTGWSMAMLGVFVYHGFAFFSVTSLKKYFKKKDANKFKAWYIDFACGGIASVIGQGISYPIDILRKRIQGQQYLLANNEIQQKQNFSGIVKSIYDIEGYRGFYKGLSINLIKGPLATGTVWVVKNQLNRRIDKAYDM